MRPKIRLRRMTDKVIPNASWFGKDLKSYLLGPTPKNQISMPHWLWEMPKPELSQI